MPGQTATSHGSRRVILSATSGSLSVRGSAPRYNARAPVAGGPVTPFYPGAGPDDGRGGRTDPGRRATHPGRRDRSGRRLPAAVGGRPRPAALVRLSPDRAAEPAA